MKKKYNFVLVNFFRVTNPYSGASEVSYNFFKNIPSKNKKLIQLSNIQQKEKQVETIIAKSKIDKVLKIFKMVNITEQLCKNNNNSVVILEGASWVGYTLLFYLLVKKNLKIQNLFTTHIILSFY